MPGFLSNTALAKTYEHYNKLASIAGDPKDRSLLQFINGLQDMGLWDKLICWPFKISQNIGSGNVVWGIGGLGEFDGTLMLSASWGLSGINTSSCAPGYVKITNGAALLSSQEITSGAIYSNTSIVLDNSNYQHYWIYGNQLGETDNPEYGGGFREGADRGLVNSMRDVDLSAAFGVSEISNGPFQFLTNVTTTELTGNSKTFLNGELKTSYTTPIYFYLGNENTTLSSINLENEFPILLEEDPLPFPTNTLNLMCQDGITNLLQQDSATLFVDNGVYDSSYQIGRMVVPSDSTWIWNQTHCVSWDSMKSVGATPVTWNNEPYKGTILFHFVIKNTTLTNEQVAFIYNLYTETIAKQRDSFSVANLNYVVPQGTRRLNPGYYLVDQQTRQPIIFSE